MTKESTAQITRPEANSKQGYPWGAILIRVLATGFGTHLGVLLGIGLGLLLRVTVIKANNPGDETLGGGSSLVVLLLFLAPLVGISAGVLTVRGFDSIRRLTAFKHNPAAVAALQKALPLCLAIQALGVLSDSSFLAFLAWQTVVSVTGVLTLAFGSTKRAQFLWIMLAGIAGLLHWSMLLIGHNSIDADVAQVFQSLSALVGIIVVIVLNHRAIESLRCAGIKAGFFGVAVRNLPPLPIKCSQETTASAPASPSRNGVKQSFYYLGPGNQTIGPVSREVLLQLQQSGAVNQETMVALEGEEQWNTMEVLFRENSQLPHSSGNCQ